MSEMDPPCCAKCGGGMERGLIVDRGHYNVVAGSTWVEGKELPRFWSGLNDKGQRQLDMLTFRCEGCGYLESYAPARLSNPPPRD